MAVSFHSEDCAFLPAGRRKIAAWVKGTIAAEGYKTGDIAFVFCSSAYHRGVNVEYLGHDYNTDVITFDYSDLAVSRTVSGDVLIDPVTARELGAEWGATPNQELLRVMIHGVLHLCGYGDKTTAEQKVMRAREDHYLAIFAAEYGDVQVWPGKA